MANAIMVLGFAIVLGLATWMFVEAGLNSGPNCPGMDPQWLGKCEVNP